MRFVHATLQHSFTEVPRWRVKVVTDTGVPAYILVGGVVLWDGHASEPFLSDVENGEEVRECAKRVLDCRNASDEDMRFALAALQEATRGHSCRSQTAV